MARIDRVGEVFAAALMALNVKTRNVSLTPENEAFIVGRVASGRFANASEVVRAALRLLQEDERRRDTSSSQQRQQGRAARPVSHVQD